MSDSDPPWYESYARLRAAGWSCVSLVSVGQQELVWIVFGRNGETQIWATGRARDQTWWEAVEQACAADVAGAIRSADGEPTS